MSAKFVNRRRIQFNDLNLIFRKAFDRRAQVFYHAFHKTGLLKSQDVKCLLLIVLGVFPVKIHIEVAWLTATNDFMKVTLLLFVVELYKLGYGCHNVFLRSLSRQVACPDLIIWIFMEYNQILGLF